MRSLIKHQDLMKRITACVAAFTLAFTLFGTPAYAAEAAETSEDIVVPAETESATVPEVPVLPADEPAAPDVPAYAPDAAVSQVSSTDSEESISNNPESNLGIAEESVLDETGSTGIDNPPADQPASEFLCTLTAQGTFDPVTQDITYTITAYNSSSNETYEGISLTGSYLLGEEPENILFSPSFSLAPGESQTFTVTKHVVFPPEVEYLSVMFTYTAICGEMQTSNEMFTDCWTDGWEEYDPNVVSYVVNYYLDSFDSEPFHIITGQGTVGDPIPVDTTIRQGEGYQPAQVTGVEILSANAEENIANVLYTRNSFGYTVNYYKDSVDPSNLIISEQGTGLYNDDIPYNMAAHAPVGYDAFAEITPVSGFTIGTVEEQNVLNVVYSRLTNIPYTIYYYLGSSDGSPIAIDSKVGTYGDAITISEDELVANVQPGYSAANAIIGGIETIGLDPEANVVEVVYPLATYGYTVNYYTDSIDPDNLITSEIGSLDYGESIPYTLGAHVPEGYNPNGAVRGATTVGYDPSQNVLNIIYSRQGGLEYAVNYYLDSTNNQPFYTDSGFGAFGDPIPVEGDSHLQPGYASYTIEGPENITAVSQNNVVNVIYQRGSYGYTVNYYTESVDPNNLITSDTGTLEYGQSIPFIMGSHVPNGYDPHGTAYGVTIVSYDSNSNVLNIVYPRATFSYTVNYYLGSIDGQLVGTNTASGLFGSTITVDEGAYVQPGYSVNPQVSGATSIGYVPEQNVVNVVYAPSFEEFYASGIAPVNTTYDGQIHYIQPEGVFSGDTITYSYNGNTISRTVGLDENIGLGFQEVTEGEITVAITVTRAGITSDTQYASVNIAAGVVPPTPDQPTNPTDPANPVDPVQPSTPGTPSSPDVPNTPTTPSTPADTPAGNVADAIAGLLGGGAAADTPAAQVDDAVDTPTVAEEDTATPEETTIEDDENPLASSPFSTESPVDHQTNPFGMVMLLSAVLCAVAGIALLAVRKRWVNTNVPTMNSEALAVEDAKTRKFALYAAISFAAALGLSITSLILLI